MFFGKTQDVRGSPFGFRLSRFGSVARVMKKTADFRQSVGRIERVADNAAMFVNADVVRSAAG